MQSIAPRIPPGGPKEETPQRQQHQHQQQRQQPRFQEQGPIPTRTMPGHVPGQGHVSSDSTSPAMLRDHMDTSTPHYSSGEVIHRTSTSSPTDPSSEQMQQDSMLGDSPTDGRKGYGKRELSTSKRAAQNRAAQRAFRQRKEGYIKKLEEQVREYGVLTESFKTIQQENYQLRDYIIALQSRLLEAQGEVPPPPGGLDGLQPGSKPGIGHQSGSSQLPGNARLPGISELQAVQPQQPPQPIQPQFHDTKMTPAQVALQSSSILRSPGGPR